MLYPCNTFHKNVFMNTIVLIREGECYGLCKIRNPGKKRSD